MRAVDQEQGSRGLPDASRGLGGYLQPALIMVITAALALTVFAGTVSAAEKKAKPALAAIESIKGDAYRMASAKMAERVTRYADAPGDQMSSDGTPAADAPKWSDIKAVYVAPTRMPAKLLTKMTSDYPRGTVGAFYGNAVDLRSKDRVIFVAVEMARKLPADVGGQQVEVGLSGNAATPVQVGTHHDTRAGVERFTLSGLFSDGAYGAGTTDVSGRQPGDDIEYYNTESGVFGFYDAKRATWYLVVPRAGDTDSISVSVRSSTGVGHVIDRLELPGGGHFIDLGDPTGGFKAKTGVSPLTCRSLETFSGESGTVELSDPASTLIRYTAGVNVETDPAKAAALLGPAIEAMGPVPVMLAPVGSEAEPLLVEADLAVAPKMNAISLVFEAPEGEWSFALADELELTTAAGEAIIDHRSLTGTAGVLTGPGIDGFVAGDLSCATEGSPLPESASGEESAG